MRRLTAALSSPLFHVALLAVGAAFLLTDAFHGNVWFDESYSIGIARHSFVDIWNIGANDVHPVLFYWCLHVIYLLLGDSLVAYRLFTVAGAVALAALGLTHLRRDFGWRCGLAFTFLALFTPYIGIMAVEVRMYSWATFAVMLCAVYAWRIFDAVHTVRADAKQADGGLWTRACLVGAEPWLSRVQIPRRWWAIFFVASFASACLHYFGAIAAFSVNVLLLIGLLTQGRACRRQVLVLLAGAVCQVLLYVPWIMALLQQMSVVSNTYWANFVFPTTLIELLTYPVMTSQLSFALRGSYGAFAQGAAAMLAVALVIATVAVIACVAARIVGAVRGAAAGRRLQALGSVFRTRSACACVAGAAVYVTVAAIGFAASVLMDSLILYYRYLVVAIGPLLLAVALLVAHVDRRMVSGAFCVVLLGLALLNQALLVSDDYAAENGAPLAYFEDVVARAAAYNEDASAPDGEAADANGSSRAGGASAESAGGVGAGGDGGAAGADGVGAGVGAGSEAAGDDGEAAGGDEAPGALVLSSDIGVEGVTAVLYPQISQTYLDWQPGNWGAAYEAYAPALSSVKSWSEALEGYRGCFVVLGQTQDGSVPRDLSDIESGFGARVVEQQTFYRPYERTWFTVALMCKN